MAESQALEDLTLRQLRLVAQQYRVSRYSRMTKQELLESIRAAKAQQAAQEVRFADLGSQAPAERSKFDLGATEYSSLDSLDEDLGELPAGYGESRIVILPRDPQWAYAYWDIPNEHKEDLRRRGGQRLMLRLYDVTGLNFLGYNAHTMIEFPCDELAREWFVPIPVSDRDFILDIGYVAASGEWLLLARSAPVRVPPMYPSTWVDDYFISIPFIEGLEGKSFAPYTPTTVQTTGALGVSFTPAAPGTPSFATTAPDLTVIPTRSVTPHDAVYQYVAHFDAQAGSVEMSSLPGFFSDSGIGVSGIGFMETTGLGAVPGVPVPSLPALSLFSGLFSGQYYSAQYGESAKARERGFWLVADAELIIYGATEPDATVTMGDQTITLNPDGTFRFHYAFPDGLREAPIQAVAVDGEQTRSITMRFLRQTPVRNTNTKAEMVVAPF
jgi:hypothetical protein